MKKWADPAADDQAPGKTIPPEGTAAAPPDPAAPRADISCPDKPARKKRVGNKGARKKRKTENVLLRGATFALKPDARQAEAMVRAVGAVRFIYNAGLEQRSHHWRAFRRHGLARRQEMTGRLPETIADLIAGGRAPEKAQEQAEAAIRKIPISISEYSQMAELTACREAFPWLKAGSVDSQQNALKDLQQSFVNFFEGRAGYPRPRRRFEDDTMRFSGRGVRIRATGHRWARIFLPKLGEIRIRTTRPLPLDCRIASATVSRTRSGEWTASVIFEVPDTHRSFWRRRPAAIWPEGAPADPVAAEDASPMSERRRASRPASVRRYDHPNSRAPDRTANGSGRSPKCIS